MKGENAREVFDKDGTGEYNLVQKNFIQIDLIQIDLNEINLS